MDDVVRETGCLKQISPQKEIMIILKETNEKNLVLYTF